MGYASVSGVYLRFFFALVPINGSSLVLLKQSEKRPKNSGPSLTLFFWLLVESFVLVQVLSVLSVAINFLPPDEDAT